jgi:hypothetical protein
LIDGEVGGEKAFRVRDEAAKRGFGELGREGAEDDGGLWKIAGWGDDAKSGGSRHKDNTPPARPD